MLGHWVAWFRGASRSDLSDPANALQLHLAELAKAKDAISCNKQPMFFAVEGHDLMMVLSGQVRLDEFLPQRRRLLAVEGLMFVPSASYLKANEIRSRRWATASTIRN